MEAPSRKHASDKQTFAILFMGYLLFVLYPILRANRPYNDDLIRAFNGTYNWDANGRPLATLLMRALEINNPAPRDGVFSEQGKLIVRM